MTRLCLRWSSCSANVLTERPLQSLHQLRRAPVFISCRREHAVVHLARPGRCPRVAHLTRALLSPRSSRRSGVFVRYRLHRQTDFLISRKRWHHRGRAGACRDARTARSRSLDRPVRRRGFEVGWLDDSCGHLSLTPSAVRSGVSIIIRYIGTRASALHSISYFALYSVSSTD